MNEEALQYMLDKLIKVEKSYALKMDINETLVRSTSRKRNNVYTFLASERNFKEVEEFNCFCSITTNGE